MQNPVVYDHIRLLNELTVAVSTDNADSAVIVVHH